MYISDKLQKPTLCLDELHELANNAVVTIGWNGSRNVSVDGYEGYTDIGQILDIYEKYAKLNVWNETDPDHDFADFELQDRIAGEHLTDQLSELILDGDEAIEKTNLFTRILAVVQRFLGLWSYRTEGLFGNESRWEFENESVNFLLFTKEQFQATFPGKEIPIPSADDLEDDVLQEIKDNIEGGGRFSVSLDYIESLRA